MKIKDSILIEARPEEVWPFLIEPEKIRAWYFPLEAFAFTSEQRGGEGATFYYVEKSPIGSVKLNFEITEWLENERIAFTMASGDFLTWNNQSWTVEPAATGSKFIFEEEAGMPYGILGKLMEFVAGFGSRANLKKMLLKLKALAESA